MKYRKTGFRLSARPHKYLIINQLDVFLDKGLCLYPDNNNETDDIIGIIRSQSSYCRVEEICIEKDGVISVELFLQKDTFVEFNEDGSTF